MKYKDIDKRKFSKEFLVTDNEILAEKYQVKQSTIRVWGARLKLNKKVWLWSRHDENFVLKNYGKKRYTIEQIANKIGRSKWAVINKYRTEMKLRVNNKYKKN